MKINNLVICGDSFHIGIGCHDLQKEPYGSLLANKYGANLYNFARGSSSNFSIMLQVKYAIENVKNIDFVCIGVTSYDRTEWFKDDSKYPHYTTSLTDVNYHEYPPYGFETYPYLLENPMKNDLNYKGKMLVENYTGVVEYLKYKEKYKSNNNNYYSKFKEERIEKFELIKNYYLEIFDIGIKRLYDIGVITMAHNLLKSKNIPHLILTHDTEFKNYIPEENIIDIDWGYFCTKFPDNLPSGHTSEKGHNTVFNQIIQKLEKKLI